MTFPRPSITLPPTWAGHCPGARPNTRAGGFAFALIEALWNCRAVSPPTAADRLGRIERELGEVRKVIA